MAGKSDEELHSLCFALNGEPGLSLAAWHEVGRRCDNLRNPDTIACWERQECAAHAEGEPLTIRYGGCLGLGRSLGSCWDASITARPGERWRGLVRRWKVEWWWRRARWGELLRPNRWYRCDGHPWRNRVYRRFYRAEHWRERIHGPWHLLLPYLWDQACWRMLGCYPRPMAW
ncbi:MAG: hypothetical protein ACRD1Y_00915 [Terriglobales bacterium]